VAHTFICLSGVQLTEMTEFQKIVSGFVQHIDNVSKEVEKEKMKVI